MSRLKTDAIRNVNASVDGITLDTSGNVAIPNELQLADKIVHTGDTNTFIRFPAADTVSVETAGSERLRITSGGRFGLGTTSPDHIFEVESNNSSIAVSRDGSNAQLLFKSNSVGQAGQIQVNESSGGGIMRFFTKTTGGTNTERLRITSDGAFGFGDTAPVPFSGYTNVSIHGSSGGAITFGDDGTDEWEIYGGDGSIRIYDRANTTERLRIKSDGKIGIGTSSPTNNVHLSKVNAGGDVSLRITNATNQNSGSTASLYFTTSPTVDFNTAYIQAVRDGGKLNFGYHSQSPTVCMRISTGNVGIGTSDPTPTDSAYDTACLHIHQATNSASKGSQVHLTTANSGSAAGDGVLLSQYNNWFYLNNQDSGGMQYHSGGSERFRIDSSGRVLIGLNSTSGVSTNAPLTIKSSGSSATRFNLVNSGSAHAESTQIYSQNQDLAFVAGGAEQVRITSGGQLRITPSGTVKMAFYHDSGAGVNHITSNNGSEIKVSCGNGNSNGIEFWDYTGVNKRCQIDAEGIKFNADTAAANGLNDYEEGSYTPALTYLTSDNGNKAYSVQHGVYTKIGRLVTVNFHLEFTNKGTGSGAIGISLPFSVPNLLTSTSLEAGGIIHYFAGLSTSWSDIKISAIDGQSRVEMYGVANSHSNNVNQFGYSHIGNSWSIRGTITYFT